MGLFGGLVGGLFGGSSSKSTSTSSNTTNVSTDIDVANVIDTGPLAEAALVSAVIQNQTNAKIATLITGATQQTQSLIKSIKDDERAAQNSGSAKLQNVATFVALALGAISLFRYLK